MKRYSKEFKDEALKLSDEIGVKKAAAQLGVEYYTIADWRRHRKADIEKAHSMMRDGGLLYKRRIPHGITKADSTTQERENLIKHIFLAAEPFSKQTGSICFTNYGLFQR